MLLDANVLLYAVDESSPHRERAEEWLTGVLTGDRLVAIPWQTVGAFLRISTHPRVFERPLRGEQAMAAMDTWLTAPSTWIPAPSERTVSLLRDLVAQRHVTGNLVPDAQLAALAIEHGIPVVSADSDFARFPEVEWINPLG